MCVEAACFVNDGMCASGVTAGSVNHDCKIDWLELNPHATHLLFRDKKQQLHLFNLIIQVPTSISSSMYSERPGAQLECVVIFFRSGSLS